nr:hypothetical protein [uncultured Hyphomonas sp.]
MADQRKSLTVQYRKLADPTNAFGGQSLQAALKRAVISPAGDEAVGKHWKRRAWTPTGDQSHTYLMNIYQDGSNSFFGDLTQYTQGYMQSLLKQEDDSPMLAVEQSPAPQGREYIHSMMYWMAVNDHLLAIQSISLSTKHLENYLSWLLNERTSAVGPTGHVILDAKFDTDDMGGNLDDINEIVVGGTGAVEAAATSSVKPEFRDVERRTDVGERRPWGQRALDVLKAVMNSEADVQKLLEEMPEGADLDVSVHIGYKSKKRKLSRAPMQRALRNLPEGDITAKGRFGKQSGKDIRLSYPARVLTKNSLPDIEDVRAKMWDAYEYFVKNGKIDP